MCAEQIGCTCHRNSVAETACESTFRFEGTRHGVLVQEGLMGNLIKLSEKGGVSTDPGKREMQVYLAFNKGDSIFKSIEHDGGARLTGESFLIVRRNELPATGITDHLLFLSAPTIPTHAPNRGATCSSELNCCIQQPCTAWVCNACMEVQEAMHVIRLRLRPTTAVSALLWSWSLAECL